MRRRWRFDEHSAPSILRNPLVCVSESDLHRDGNVAAMLDRRAAARKEAAASALSAEQLRSRTETFRWDGIKSTCSYFTEQERGKQKENLNRRQGFEVKSVI